MSCQSIRTTGDPMNPHPYKCEVCGYDYCFCSVRDYKPGEDCSGEGKKSMRVCHRCWMDTLPATATDRRRGGDDI